MIGRPTSLTPEVSALLLKAVRLGNYKATACAEAGIHRDTLNDWEHRGAKGEEPFASFTDALKKAEALAERRLLSLVRKGGEGWQSKAWIMERRWPSKWGGRVRATVSDERESLLAKVTADPELHQRLRDVIGEGAAQAPATAAH